MTRKRRSSSSSLPRASRRCPIRGDGASASSRRCEEDACRPSKRRRERTASLTPSPLKSPPASRRQSVKERRDAKSDKEKRRGREDDKVRRKAKRKSASQTPTPLRSPSGSPLKNSRTSGPQPVKEKKASKDKKRKRAGSDSEDHEKAMYGPSIGPAKPAMYGPDKTVPCESEKYQRDYGPSLPDKSEFSDRDDRQKSSNYAESVTDAAKLAANFRTPLPVNITAGMQGNADADRNVSLWLGRGKPSTEEQSKPPPRRNAGLSNPGFVFGRTKNARRR